MAPSVNERVGGLYTGDDSADTFSRNLRIRGREREGRRLRRGLLGFLEEGERKELWLLNLLRVQRLKTIRTEVKQASVWKLRGSEKGGKLNL